VRTSERQIIRMMREEYRAHLESVIKELSEKPADGMQPSQDVEDPGDTKKDEKPKDKEPRVKYDKLSIDTRVTHMPQGGSRGFEYTVTAISSDSATLIAGDGERLEVDRKTLEKEYVVD